MVIKVFLVEDELIIREGIKNNIDWVGNGFEFCGEASDGELAFQQILECRPDIIITDIKMPFMDGLELSRLVKRAIPKCKIIIISGHEEFNFAQEALKIGVIEYLLKPINSRELLKVVKKVGALILKEEEEQSNIKKIHQNMKEKKVYVKNQFFCKLVNGEFTTATLLENGKNLGIDLVACYYQIIIIKIKKNDYEQTATEQFQELLIEFPKVHMFEFGIQECVFLLKSDTDELIDDLENRLVQTLKSMKQIELFGGIGIKVNRLSEISESFHIAEKAFAYSFICNRNDIIRNEDVKNYLQKEDEISYDQMGIGNVDFKIMENFLRNGHSNDLEEFLNAFFENVGPAIEQSTLFKQYVLMNIYMTVATFVKEIGKDVLLNNELPYSIEDIKSIVVQFGKSKIFMQKLMSYALDIRDCNTKHKYNYIVEKAKSYMTENYHKDSLSLNDVAKYIGVSASHFSSIFSTESGSSFIRYLTNLRMSEAKRLLKCTNMRCADISVEIGYKDPHYFSYLFKKEYNITPMNYRYKKTSKEE